MSSVLRPVLSLAGSLCVALGVAGVFLPLVPTTPFLLLAAACYARSSPRMLRWMNENRLFGQALVNWREGRGIPRRAKVVAIALIWITIGATVMLTPAAAWIRIALLAVAALVTAHLLWMPTLRERADHPLPTGREAR